MTADDQHSELRHAWELLRADLIGLRDYLDSGDTHYMEFTDKADRAANLTFHLDGVVQLLDQHLYAPAFALTRTCLEHAVLDWLLCRGRTFVQRFTGVTPEMWTRYQAERTAGAGWTTTIVDWRRTKKGDLTVYREGLYSEPDSDGNRDQVSIYYFLLDDYDGLLGRPADQEDDGFLTRDELRTMATEQQDRWNVYLRWSALLDNLAVNDLIDGAARGRLGVHYRFLSTFAHPVSHTQRQLYGRQLDGRPVQFDHYSSELAILYVVAIATLEIENFRDGLAGNTEVTLVDTDRLDRHLGIAKRASAQLWFIGATPDRWDFHNAWNEAAMAAYLDDIATPTHLPSADEVPFSRDPLQRLVQMHRSSGASFGSQSYQSPWPRPDAFTR